MAAHKGLGIWIPSFVAMKRMKIQNGLVCKNGGKHDGKPYLLRKDYRSVVLETINQTTAETRRALKSPKDVVELVDKQSGYFVNQTAITKLHATIGDPVVKLTGPPFENIADNNNDAIDLGTGEEGEQQQHC
jgi:hypothetical protein